jgi:putative FmdB family regulatory protein
MPIYEYQCEKCGHHLEALQKISDKPLRECPECGRHSLKRLVSAPRFRLAGSGWYETDFKSEKENKRNLVEKGEKEAAKAGDTPPSPASSTPESKPESKPATKAEPARESKTRTMISKPSPKPTARSRAGKPTRKPAASRGRKR